MIMSKLFLVSVTKKLDHLRKHGLHAGDSFLENFAHLRPAFFLKGADPPAASRPVRGGRPVRGL